MAQINSDFLTRIESLGDNCELGFVFRKARYEKGGLFRWAITPVDKLISFLSDPNQELFRQEDLVPFGPGMVLDKRSGFSFHSKMRSEKNCDGELQYIIPEGERSKIHATEKSKIDYLKSGFINRLNAPDGTIYLIKANRGIAEEKMATLASLILNYSPRHVLVHVVDNKPDNVENLIQDRGNYYTASIGRFAPYVAANDVLYSDWDKLLVELTQHDEINKRIGESKKAA